MLQRTKILDTTEEIKFFLIGLNSSTEIKFDKADLIYSGNLNGEPLTTLLKQIS